MKLGSGIFKDVDELSQGKYVVEVLLPIVDSVVLNIGVSVDCKVDIFFLGVFHIGKKIVCVCPSIDL